MSYQFTNVKRYKRGATWNDGTPAICTRCRVEGRSRANRGVVRATMKYAGVKTVIPVAYCEEHVPGELRKDT